MSVNKAAPAVLIFGEEKWDVLFSNEISIRTVFQPSSPFGEIIGLPGRISQRPPRSADCPFELVDWLVVFNAETVDGFPNDGGGSFGSQAISDPARVSNAKAMHRILFREIWNSAGIPAAWLGR